MSAVLFFARKDIEANKKTFLVIILAISMVNANIIVLNGTMDGMVSGFIDKTMETSSGHLNIYPDVKDRYIEGLGIKEKKFEKIDGIVAISPRLTAGGSLSYKEYSKSIKIMALYPLREKQGHLDSQ